MPRLLFQKTGNSVWISHLDLMRLFQRAFKRAGYPLTHTHGYNPRPAVSIALPLSVGIESQCELLDFELECETVPFDILKAQLNSALVDGVEVLDIIPEGEKIRNLTYLRTHISLVYDNGIPEGAATAISSLFSRESVIVTKKTNRYIQEQNIIPMIKDINVSTLGDQHILLDALHCCQNPTLNPTQISAAIEKYIPEFAPDVCKYRRIEVYDSNNTIFR